MNRKGFLLFIVVNAISIFIMAESQGLFSVIMTLLILYFNVGVLSLNKCRELIEECEIENDTTTILKQKQKEKKLNKIYIFSGLFIKVVDYFKEDKQ